MCEQDNNDRASKVTVYRKAVPQVIPDVNQQINQFIQDVRNNIEGSARNISSSSDEIMMDISDESDLQIDSNNLNVISGNSQVTDWPMLMEGRLWDMLLSNQETNLR